jgi:hypothetical protein
VERLKQDNELFSGYMHQVCTQSGFGAERTYHHQPLLKASHLQFNSLDRPHPSSSKKGAAAAECMFSSFELLGTLAFNFHF